MRTTIGVKKPREKVDPLNELDSSVSFCLEEHKNCKFPAPSVPSILQTKMATIPLAPLAFAKSKTRSTQTVDSSP